MKLVRSAALAAVAAAVVAVPASSYADARGHTDPKRDVRSVAIDENGNLVTTPSTAEPAATFADVTKVGVTHGSRTVTVVMHFRDLRKAGIAQEQQLLILSPKRNRLVLVDAAPGNWRGKVSMRTLHNKKVACGNLTRKIDYAHDKIRIGVPRSCLGRPSVVKVGTFSEVAIGSKLYYDDGFTNGGEFNDPFGLSPKVHR
jgi:hypothetical protein